MFFSKGAEADLSFTEYFGHATVSKERLPKRYRNEILDKRIRKSRTQLECTLIQKARSAGVRTPLIYSIDKGGSRILMERIEGKRMKDCLSKSTLKVCSKTGKAIAQMHSANIIHGDLTTSNIIIAKENPCFIDFGLGFESAKLEDKAVDLLNFKKTYNATHFKFPAGWKAIIGAYRKSYSAGKEVLAQMEDVEARVRYH
jgi:Kae1-associated kinase Bud32